MRWITLCWVYLALATGAIADTAAVEALREGDMRKLQFHGEAQPTSAVAFEDFDGNPLTLADLQGKYLLVNFWATWCAPCRHEMPMIAALQSEFGGDDFAVITIATGRNEPMAMQDFFAEIGVDNLPLHRDPRQKLARDMAVLGLPMTVIINPEGLEIARLRGDADWSSDSAKAIIAALTGG